MITLLNHYILDYAINIVFDGIEKNFAIAKTDFIHDVNVGDTIQYIHVNLSGHVIKAHNVAITQIFRAGGPFVIYLRPLGVADIEVKEDADESYISYIESSLEWTEEFESPAGEHRLKAKFGYAIGVNIHNIVGYIK
jgi:plastocyanin